MAYKRALIIEDEPLIRMMLVEFLEEVDFDVVEAHNGQAGIELYNSCTPNIVILDLRMPIVDGIAFLEKINVKENKNCDVIVFSGHGGGKEEKRSLELGASIFLKKPFDHEELVSNVQRLVAAQRSHS